VKSTFLTVLAWLGIVFFGFAVVMGIAQAFLFRSLFRDPEVWRALADSLPGGPSPEAAMAGAGMTRWMSWVFLAGSMLGLAASIGLLHRRNWARLTVIGFLAVNLIWTLAAIVGAFLAPDISLVTPPGWPGGQALAGMMRQMLIFASVAALAVAALCGWLIARLASAPIRAECVGRVA